MVLSLEKSFHLFERKREHFPPGVKLCGICKEQFIPNSSTTQDDPANQINSLQLDDNPTDAGSSEQEMGSLPSSSGNLQFQIFCTKYN